MKSNELKSAEYRSKKDTPSLITFFAASDRRRLTGVASISESGILRLRLALAGCEAAVCSG